MARLDMARLEISTLSIPGTNHSDAEIVALKVWISRWPGDYVQPVFTAFHPDWNTGTKVSCVLCGHPADSFISEPPGGFEATACRVSLSSYASDRFETPSADRLPPAVRVSPRSNLFRHLRRNRYRSRAITDGATMGRANRACHLPK